MALNLVIPNKDNRVVLIFGGVVLADSTNIIMELGSESFSTTGVSPKLEILPASGDDPERLSCDLSGTAEVGKIFATVTYFDGASTNGTDITSRELNNLSQIIIAVGSQLIIEDGSIVDNANSFANDEEFKNHANLRCMDVPATQPAREALLILAMDYLFDKENKMKGCRVNIDQELMYPRNGVCANNFRIPSDSIPKSLKKAQMELALQANTSPILINASVKNVSKEKLGELEVEYFSGGAWASVQTERADAFLDPLLSNGGSNNIMMRV